MQRPPRFICAAALLSLGFSKCAGARPLVASYSFNDTLAANQAGKPSLVSVDPLGLNTFETAVVVNGASQRVFHWNGERRHANQQRRPAARRDRAWSHTTTTRSR